MRMTVTVCDFCRRHLPVTKLAHLDVCAECLPDVTVDGWQSTYNFSGATLPSWDIGFRHPRRNIAVTHGLLSDEFPRERDSTAICTNKGRTRSLTQWLNVARKKGAEFTTEDLTVAS